MNLDKISFQSKIDERGSLVILEENKQIPFEVKRLYYMYGIDSEQSRGFHAHKALTQMAFVIQGKCQMLMDDGVNKVDVCLDSPQKGLLIEPMIWHVMTEFSDNCILMVLADGLYDEGDYIRDYNEFVEVVKNAS
jgi:dTDP-4-dehydrorhamnose 3,5-epimerase-like enzyme